MVAYYSLLNQFSFPDGRMFSRAWKSISAKNGAVQKFYSQYKYFVSVEDPFDRTAFTVVTTLIGTSAAWASYFARAKHNQKLLGLHSYSKA